MDPKDRSLIIKAAIKVLPLPALAGLVGGGLLWWAASVEQAILDGTSPGPREVELAELLAKGPGVNRHVLVTGFKVAAQVAVKEKEASRWAGVVAELLTPGQDEVKGPVLAVLYLDSTQGRADLDRIAAAGRVRALSLQGITEFPSSRWSQVSELTEGRAPSTAPMRLVFEPELPTSQSVGHIWILAWIVLGVGVISALGFAIAWFDGPDEDERGGQGAPASLSWAPGESGRSREPPAVSRSSRARGPSD